MGTEKMKIFDFDNPRLLEKTLSGKELHQKLLLLNFSKMLKKHYLGGLFWHPYHTNGIKARLGWPVMMYSSWGMECNGQNFCHFRLFFALLPPWWLGKSKFWKTEKNTWRYNSTNVYHKWQLYDVWFLWYGVCQTEFFLILGYFFALYHPNNTKNQTFEKKLKIKK